jgi:hypothetical protein
VGLWVWVVGEAVTRESGGTFYWEQSLRHYFLYNLHIFSLSQFISVLNLVGTWRNLLKTTSCHGDFLSHYFWKVFFLYFGFSAYASNTESLCNLVDQYTMYAGLGQR